MMLINTTDKLYQLNILHLCLIMYADDTALFSERASELRNMLDTLHVYTTEWNINVNINQTKVVVFKKVGNLKPDEKWIYNGKYLEIVSTILEFAFIIMVNLMMPRKDI